MAEAKETQNILKQLYSSSASVAKASEENSTTLQSIYKLQLESEKRRKAAQKKTDTEARRKLRDDKRDDLDQEKKDKKEKKEVEKTGESLGDKLKEGLSGLLGGIGPILTGALAGLLPAITGALGTLASGILGAVKGLGGLMKAGFGALKPILSGAISKILALPALSAIATGAGAVALSGAAVVGVAVGAGKAMEAERRARYGGGEAGDLAQKMYEKELEVKAANQNNRGRATRERTEEEKEVLQKIEETRKELLEVKKERELMVERKKSEINKITKNIKSNRSGSKKVSAEQQQAIDEINNRYAVLEDRLDQRIGAITKRSGDTFDKKKKPVKRQSGGKIPGAFTVPGSGDGDQFPIDLPAGSFVLNRNASDALRQGLQRGGQTQMVPTLLEPGERVFLPGQWENSGIEKLNKTVSRFQTGGEVREEKQTNPGTVSPINSQEPEEEGEEKEGGKKKHPILEKLSDKNIKKVGSAPGLCVTGSLDTMKASGVPEPAATGLDKGNNPRGGAVQLIKDFGWKSLGGSPITLKSPYGTVSAGEHTGAGYNQMVESGKVPSGALVFQTRHADWNGTSPSSRGYDMAIAQKGGREHWNGQPMPQNIYSNVKKVIVLTPDGQASDGSDLGAPGGGTPGQAGGSGGADNAAATGASPVQGIIGQLGGMGEEGQKIAEFLGGLTGIFGALTGAKIDLSGGTEGAGSETVSGGTQGGGSNLSLGGATPGGEFGESALIAAMDSAGMTNKLERASFLAQMAHESDNFRASEEYASGEAYEGRTDLGNTQPGDGVRYKGRGYIQITGRYNYKKFGDIVGHDLVNNPELASDPNIAAQVALAYWKDRGISGPAQKGDNKQVTYLINGGYNGLKDRQEKFAKYKQQGLQTGGLVNMKRAVNKLDERMQAAQTKVNEKEAKEAGAGPIVITKSSGGGGGGKQTVGPGTIQKPPTLPEGCSATLAADYTYNLSLGGY